MGNVVNSIRVSLGITVQEFSERLGYSISYITKIIYDEREPSRKFLKKLKKVYPEVDMNIFFS